MSDRPSRWWYALLALPLLGLLYPPLYARRDPEIAGIPFFYWYQFARSSSSGRRSTPTRASSR